MHEEDLSRKKKIKIERRKDQWGEKKIPEREKVRGIRKYQNDLPRSKRRSRKTGGQFRPTLTFF